MQQPKDPGKGKKLTKEIKDSSGIQFEDDTAARLFGITGEANAALDFGKYDRFFKEEGNTYGGARSLRQIGNSYNTDTFKSNILPELQELNPDTDFQYDGNTYACGGKIYAGGGELENNLTEFNAGGSHEENPNGGIQQGTGANGLPNRVEEGETKKDNYVYSDRLKVKSKYVKQFNLPKYTAGKTNADASKLIEKKFEDREDNASNSTKKILLDRLAKAQEYNKLEREAALYDLSVDQLIMQKEAEEEERAKTEQMTADKEASEQLPPGTEEQLQNAPIEPLEGTNQFAPGGDLNLSGLSGLTGMADAAMTDLDSEQRVREHQNVGGSAIKYGVMGAGVGTMIFPGIGTAAGAAVGAATGATIATVSNNKIAGEQQEADQEDAGNKLRAAGFNSNAYGGYNSMKDGDAINKAMGASGALMSLTPLISNAVSAATIERNDPNKYARVGRTYVPQFDDEESRLNVINEGFSGSEDLIAGASAGNLGAYRANITGLGAHKAMARSKGFDAVNAINRRERGLLNADFASAAKENVDLYNQEYLENRQDKAAYDADRRAYMTATMEGLGDLGNMLATNSIGETTYNWWGGKKRTDAEKKAAKDTKDYKRAARKMAKDNKNFEG